MCNCFPYKYSYASFMNKLFCRILTCNSHSQTCLRIRFMGSFYLHIFLDLSLGDFNLAHLVFLIIRETLDQRNARIFLSSSFPLVYKKETNVELPFSYHLLTFRNKNKYEMILKFLDMVINYSYRLQYLLLYT